MNHKWREESLSRLNAMAANRAPDFWPPPCEVCGVGWKVTPGGRWFIEHSYPHQAPGVFASQPALLPAPKPRDPLLEDDAA